MVVGQGSEQAERVVLPMARIKHDDLIFARVIIVFIECQQFVDTEIGEHAAYAIHEDVWAAIIVFNVDVVENALVQKLHKLGTMGVSRKGLLRFWCS